MPCRYCGLSGHNIRTCNARIYSEDFGDLPMELEDFTRMNLQTFFDAEEDPITDEELERDECIICYEAITDGNVKLKCNHKYCLSCFIQHMRTKNECAYCRQKVCDDLPEPKKQLEMVTETRRALLDHFMNNSTDITELYKADFMRQMYESIVGQQQALNTRATERMIDMCMNAAETVDLSFEMWTAGLIISEYTSDWYER